MTRDEPVGIGMAAGPLGAIALGIALIPLRTVTSASNLAFVFLVLTIVVAELGGRGAALATATVSAMSLNFFLTEPYLTLLISKTDDVIAFVGLTVCGLIAAAFGTRRARWSAAAGRARDRLDAVTRLLRELATGTPLDAVLEQLRQAFGLRAIVVRNADEATLAAAPADAPGAEIPATQLSAPAMLAADGTSHRLGRRGFRLPEGGGRLRLPAGQGFISVDLWEGDPRGLDLDESHALSIAVSILGLELARRRAESGSHPDR